MPVTDPVADMLTRIRNALLVQHPVVEMPSSKGKVSVAEILKREGYIQDYEVAKRSPQDLLRVRLRYTDTREPAITGLRRVSKPGPPCACRAPRGAPILRRCGDLYHLHLAGRDDRAGGVAKGCGRRAHVLRVVGAICLE